MAQDPPSYYGNSMQNLQGQFAQGPYMQGPGMVGMQGMSAGPYPADYGGVSSLKMESSSPFKRGHRQRLNVVAILLSAFIPWAVFCITFALLSFSFHFTQPLMCKMLVGAMLLFVVVCGALAGNATRQKMSHSHVTQYQPSWYVFLFVSVLVAWVTGLIAGECNYQNHMKPYLSLINLNTYTDVDPSSTTAGRQFMDAGIISFVPNTYLDVSKAMGFKSLDVYCVAPITLGNGSLASYDMWAVGTNCCSGTSNDYHCGEYSNPAANGAVRLMDDDQRAYFRLAVQEAEATYHIQATHPLFFEWVQDPVVTVHAWRDSSYKMYLIGMFGYFIFQLFWVVVGTLAFAKLGHV